ncbi:YggS family pyridoxal phosphate-dependent enzyme [Pantoea sp. Aalb]|uniref:YggS family pyridoxal phosphate-dependent enzyme n=1 Tax=Pantoea sp. Aalb TaxID=2576762 RepID=UPI0013238AD1|nr:YggS family pyridoxal phosphate-dependent enzyme [Pantoea sp. Aalb]MXP67719.1 YggS family pyridoxal phosphate-dependent enzyme [Pantoea sp. Aalb]
MTYIKNNLYQVRERIKFLTKYYGRASETIKLVAVSKNKSISEIIEAINAGQQEFGENYVQECIEKIIKLKNYPKLQWHFIGHLQANKSRLIAENISWCHTIDGIKIAKRLNKQRPDFLPPLNVLIQINISKEKNKFGILLEDLKELAQQVSSLPRLSLRGLMAVPTAYVDYYSQLEVYKKMALAFYSLQKKYPKIDTLSLGMSNDLDAAIAAGSNLVRIGTNIFGVRV